MKHGRLPRVFDQMDYRLRNKIGADQINRVVGVAGNHRRQPVVKQPHRVMDGVEPGNLASRRIPYHRAQPDNDEWKTAHSLEHELLHLGFRLLVSIDEARPGVAAVRLAEEPSSPAAHVNGAEKRSTFE